MNLFELEFLLKDAWTSETCFKVNKEKWSANNPTYGQSLVTSLAANDFVGGRIFVCNSSTGDHYFNVIDDKIFDLTTKQFYGETILYGNNNEVFKEELLKDEEIKNKYFIFLNNIKNNLKLMTKDIDNIFDKNEIKSR